MSQGVKARGKRKRWGTTADAVTVNIRNVPKDIRAQFKAYCARRGYTMEATIIALMRKCIYDDITLPEARNQRMKPADEPAPRSDPGE